MQLRGIQCVGAQHPSLRQAGKVRIGGAAVSRIIVVQQELLDQAVPVALTGHGIPFVDHLVPVQGRQRCQSLRQQCRVVQEVIVFFQQQVDARGQWRLDDNAI